MTAFVLAAAALALLAAAAVVVGPRLQRRAGAISQSRTNAAVLRQQLAELEVEAARGQLAAEDFARARDDLQRRLLAEADAGAAAGARVPAPHRALLVYAVLLPLAAAALYRHFGHPQLLAAPPAALPMSADVSAMTEGEPLLPRLEAHVAAAPNDARAWVMLARLRMQRDEFEPAAFAYQRALDASPSRVARDPLVWCELADALGMAQGGRLAGRPRELIDKALALDAAHPRALEMAGSAAYEAGDFRAAARWWQQLLGLLPSDSAERAQLAAAIARAEQRAKFVLPPT